MTPAINKPLPEFEAAATGGLKVSPQTFHGQAVVLYFYPKDHTPGCTTEAMQFRDRYKDFVKAGALILGVSRDNMASPMGMPVVSRCTRADTPCHMNQCWSASSR